MGCVRNMEGTANRFDLLFQSDILAVLHAHAYCQIGDIGSDLTLGAAGGADGAPNLLRALYYAFRNGIRIQKAHTQQMD